MRVTLGQQAHQRSQMTDTVDRVRGRKETGRPQIESLDGVVAEMFIESRPPSGAYAIARLEHRLKARARSAPHKAKMATMLTRHQLEDGIALPVTLDAKHDAFISPLHGADSRRRLVVLY